MHAVEALKVFMTPSGANRQKVLRQLGSIIRTAEAAADVRNKRVVVCGEMVAVPAREHVNLKTFAYYACCGYRIPL
jgi:hypothetical protein